MRAFSGFLAVCFLVIVGSFPSHAQERAVEIVEGWIASAQNQDFITVSHGGISHDDSSGVTTVSELAVTLTLSSKSLKIDKNKQSTKSEPTVTYYFRLPTVEFDGLSADASYYSARSIRADVVEMSFNTEIDGGETETSGTYDGLVVNDVKWAKLPEITGDGSGPASKFYPLIAALTDFSFKNFVIGQGNFVQEGTNPPIKTEITYGRMTGRDAVNGNVQQYGIEETHITVKAGNKPSTIVLGKITVDNYNAGDLVAMFAPDAPTSGGYKNIAEKISFGSIKVTFDNEGTFSIGSMSVRDFAMKPSEVSLLQTLDTIISQISRGHDEPDMALIADLISSTYGAMKLGKFEISGIRFDVKGEANGKVDSFAIDDLSGEGMAGLLVAGLEFSANDGTYLRTGLFNMRNLTFPSINSLFNLERAATRMDIPALMKAIPTIERISIHDLKLKAPREGEFSVAGNSISMGGFIGPIPTSVATDVSHFVMPVDALDREPREGLKAMGYDTIDVSYSLKFNWEEISKTISIAVSGSMKDGGKLEALAKLGGIPRSLFENPRTAQNIVPTVTFHSAKVTYNDQSLADRVIKMLARQQGIEPGVFRQQIVGAIPFALQKLNNPEFIQSVTSAVTNLLESGGSISATAQPASPFPLIALVQMAESAPGAMLELLKVKVASE